MSSEGGGYLKGLVAGALIGAATALLLAPKRGDEMRRELAENAGRVRDRAEGLGERASTVATDLKGRGQGLIESARDKGGDLIASAGEQVEGLKDQAGQSVSELKEETEGEVGDAKEKAHDVVESV